MTMQKQVREPVFRPRIPILRLWSSVQETIKGGYFIEQ
jgi:hypothetical protein